MAAQYIGADGSEDEDSGATKGPEGEDKGKKKAGAEGSEDEDSGATKGSEGEDKGKKKAGAEGSEDEDNGAKAKGQVAHSAEVALPNQSNQPSPLTKMEMDLAEAKEVVKVVRNKTMATSREVDKFFTSLPQEDLQHTKMIVLWASVKSATLKTDNTIRKFSDYMNRTNMYETDVRMGARQTLRSLQTVLAKQSALCVGLKDRLEAHRTDMKTRVDVIASTDSLSKAEMMLEKAEQSCKALRDADRNFSIVVEMRHIGEIIPSAVHCKEAAAAHIKALEAGKSCVKAKLTACQHYEKDVASSTAKALNTILLELHTIYKSTSYLIEDGLLWRMAPFLAEFIGAAQTTKEKVKIAECAIAVLQSESLEREAIATIESAVKQGIETVMDAKESCARLPLQDKRLLALYRQGDPTMSQIYKEQESIQVAICTMQSHIATAVKLLKAKDCYELCEEAVIAAEREVAKAVTDAPSQGSAFTMEIAASFDTVLASAAGSISIANRRVRPHTKNMKAGRLETIEMPHPETSSRFLSLLRLYFVSSPGGLRLID